MWKRGGISCGKLHHEANVFGEGFINAYELEKLAIFPRVLIDPKVLKEFEDYESIAQLRDAINQPNLINFANVDYIFERLGSSNLFSGDDVAMFVNYMRPIAAVANDLETLYQNLVKRIESDGAKYYPKYNWVARYIGYTLTNDSNYSSWEKRFNGL